MSATQKLYYNNASFCCALYLQPSRKYQTLYNTWLLPRTVYPNICIELCSRYNRTRKSMSSMSLTNEIRIWAAPACSSENVYVLIDITNGSNQTIRFWRFNLKTKIHKIKKFERTNIFYHSNFSFQNSHAPWCELYYLVSIVLFIIFNYTLHVFDFTCFIANNINDFCCNNSQR